MENKYNGATVAFLAIYEHEHILVMLRKNCVMEPCGHVIRISLNNKKPSPGFEPLVPEF